MNKKVIKGLILVYFALFSLVPGHSQPVNDSLIHYLEIAAKSNAAILQKFNEYQAALQKMPQVGSLPDPELNMGVFLSPMELVSGNQVADLRLMQMFPWFGTLRAAKDEMSLMANAKYEAFRDAKSEVLYKVQSLWYELYKVQQSLELSEKNIDILRSIEKLALVKFRSAPTVNSTTVSQVQKPQNMPGNSMETNAFGSSLSDLYRVQIEIGELENSKALIRNQQTSLVAQFNGLLNRKPEFPVALPDTLIADSLAVSLLAVSDSMIANNPMLGMLQYEQKSLEYRKKMVIKMGYPMMGVGLNYSVIRKNEMSASAMNGKDMMMPMVTLTLPIYRRKYRAMQTETDLLKTAMEQNYSATATNLNTEYYQAVQLYQDAQRRIILYRNQRLLAGKSMDILIQSFAVSGSGLTDILRIRQQTLDYDYKSVEALADNNTAIAWLKRLMAFEQEQ